MRSYFVCYITGKHHFRGLKTRLGWVRRRKKQFPTLASLYLADGGDTT